MNLVSQNPEKTHKHDIQAVAISKIVTDCNLHTGSADTDYTCSCRQLV